MNIAILDIQINAAMKSQKNGDIIYIRAET